MKGHFLEHLLVQKDMATNAFNFIVLWQGHDIHILMETLHKDFLICVAYIYFFIYKSKNVKNANSRVLFKCEKKSCISTIYIL